MKKSKIIKLVLITASLSSCNSWVPSWQTTAPNENLSRQDTNHYNYQDTNYYSYNGGYYNYNWYFYHRAWCRHFYGRRGNSPEVVHYGPRHPIGSNVLRHSAISRGGFGATGHSSAGHSASA